MKFEIHDLDNIICNLKRKFKVSVILKGIKNELEVGEMKKHTLPLQRSATD